MCIRDRVDAVAELVQLVVRLQCCPLDQGVGGQVEAGHLAVNPDDPVIGRASVGVLGHAPTLEGGCNQPAGILCAPGRTRTCDLEIRRLLLYPAELRGHVPAARAGNAVSYTHLTLPTILRV